MKNINYKEVYEQTLENGGHTVDIGGRYMVAIAGYEVIIPVEEFNGSVVELYSKYSMPRIINATLGTWVHNNNVYLDSSIAFSSLEEALKVAKENNQIAIFDTVALEEIKVK